MHFVNGVHRGFHQKYGDRFTCGMAFEDFLEEVSTIPDEKADGHFRSQWTFLVDKRGNFLVDYLVRFELLADDLQYVFDKIHLPAANMPHLLNTRTGTDWASQFSEHGKKLVRERYAKDFELLGFEKPSHLFLKFLKRKVGM
jgi:hypothetical protein